MGISIDWGTKIISIPKADLAWVEGETYKLDIDWFRMQLKGLEDGEPGIAYPDTHKHNTEVTIGGMTLTRVVEIINGYTVTFEDGQYAVNLTGANSNISDVVNLNQVSVRSFNSAGAVVVETGTSGLTEEESEQLQTLPGTGKIAALINALLR